MAYDEDLAERVRDALEGERGLAEKKMFGGLAFLLDGNMAVGVTGDALMVRLSAADGEDALAEPGARPFDMTGRPMKGWLLVDPAGHRKAADLGRWVGRGVAFARTMPPK
ncbi:TfoX/Sxy family protein [Amycolatopsis nalaikhensis]|uniref:TfoX/Sxy family protein n=1 Tax=Amycolatopsis nalaikhensis TaxID=715472 RepID=A0ABY8XLP6_9PSEU|nr:TfoX/Sxy family protein [Amycolatopsis sp. 2-2]WIV56559.1 TfoX/Sxy family protein [Amycolatopsis sp. 2-2]